MTYSGPEPTRIRDMFRSIAGRYDRANTILSGGIHHLWRRKAVRWSAAREGDRVLDCATGTGDLAIAFRRVVGASGHVVGTDFVPEMLEVARAKTTGGVAQTLLSAQSGQTGVSVPHITFEVADVTQLPYDDASFDVASIAFGIRNVGDPRRGIAEMARVVKPGGRVIVLELGQPRSRVVGALYNIYSRHLLPRLGGAITGERSAYEYLESSAARFPSGEAFATLMRESAPFASVEVRALTFGVAYLYRGVKA